MQEKYTQYDTFFQKVDEIFKLTGFSTTKIAEMIGISRQTFYAYQKQQKPITLKSMNMLDLALEKARGTVDSNLDISNISPNEDVKKLIAIRDEIQLAFTEINNRLSNIDKIINSKKI